MTLQLKLKKLHPDAIMPTLGSKSAACYDLYALEDTTFNLDEIKLVRTGWAAELPPGYRLNLYVRSSTPLKRGYMLANSVGIIDNDYRGEIMIQLIRISKSEFTDTIKAGEKIAQIEIVKYESITDIVIVDELSSTERGDGGFGSTGN